MPEPHEPARLDDELATVGSLLEPVRRALYDYVAGRGDEVSRDEAAAAVGVQRKLAAFHLDKLVDVGLLEATYRRLSGRVGPGAGRPAKLYRRSPTDHAVSVPHRQYDLAAELLAEAVEEAGDRPARESLSQVARRFGNRLGREIKERIGGRAVRERRLVALAETLERYGYKPRREGSAVHLANCPFHALAKGHTDLVCGMNLSLMEGLVDGMEGGLEARSDPRPNECCVTVGATLRRR